MKFYELLTLLPKLTLKDFVIQQQEKSYELSIEEWFHVLEFYLSYQNPRRISTQLGYDMKRCKDRNCRFCYERLDLTDRFEPAMCFSNNQIHRFVNNYQISLNYNVVSFICYYSKRENSSSSSSISRCVQVLISSMF